MTTPKPPLDWNVSGWAQTGRTRIVHGWLWPRIEAEWAHEYGEVVWIRADKLGPRHTPKRPVRTWDGVGNPPGLVENAKRLGLL